MAQHTVDKCVVRLKGCGVRGMLHAHMLYLIVHCSFTAHLTKKNAFSSK